MNGKRSHDSIRTRTAERSDVVYGDAGEEQFDGLISIHVETIPMSRAWLCSLPNIGRI